MTTVKITAKIDKSKLLEILQSAIDNDVNYDTIDISNVTLDNEDNISLDLEIGFDLAADVNVSKIIEALQDEIEADIHECEIL